MPLLASAQRARTVRARGACGRSSSVSTTPARARGAQARARPGGGAALRLGRLAQAQGEAAGGARALRRRVPPRAIASRTSGARARIGVERARYVASVHRDAAS